MYLYSPVIIRPLNVRADTPLRSMVKITQNAVSAGLPAQPEIYLKNRIPASLLNAICADGEVEPLCVQVCRPGALTYIEEEKEREKEPKLGEVEAGLQTLINRYGLQQVIDYVARISKK